MSMNERTPDSGGSTPEHPRTEADVGPLLRDPPPPPGWVDPLEGLELDPEAEDEDEDEAEDES